jgi:GH18 family chitinase
MVGEYSMPNIFITFACIHIAYNFKRIADNVDWVGIMTYDYAAASGKTAHHSPYTGPHPNTVDSIQIWLNQNIPSNKLIMGIPLYGRSFTLMDTGIHGVGAPASIGKPGPFTDEPGFIAYFEFCSGWTYRSDVGAGAYAFIDNQWVSYNDVDSIKEKAAYVKQFKLGGVMVWALDLDDWNGEFCNQGKYPLLRELKNSI